MHVLYVVRRIYSIYDATSLGKRVESVAYKQLDFLFHKYIINLWENDMPVVFLKNNSSAVIYKVIVSFK